jgi:hypothetical protein
MKAKSSDGIAGSCHRQPGAPGARSAGAGHATANSASCGWFTTAGTLRVNSKSHCASKAAQVCVGESLHAPFDRSVTSSLKVRTVPSTVQRSGTTLPASPPWIIVTDSTAVSIGRLLRLTMVCRPAPAGRPPASGRRRGAAARRANRRRGS